MKRASILGAAVALGILALGGCGDAGRQEPAPVPVSAEEHYELGLALLRSGDAEGAVAEIEAALSLAPPDASWRKEAEDAMVLALLRRGKREAR